MESRSVVLGYKSKQNSKVSYIIEVGGQAIIKLIVSECGWCLEENKILLLPEGGQINGYLSRDLNKKGLANQRQGGRSPGRRNRSARPPASD